MNAAEWVQAGAAAFAVCGAIGAPILRGLRIASEVKQQLGHLTKEVNDLKRRFEDVESEQRQSEIRAEKVEEQARAERDFCQREVADLRRMNREQGKALNWISKSLHAIAKQQGTHLDHRPIVSDDE